MNLRDRLARLRQPALAPWVEPPAPEPVDDFAAPLVDRDGDSDNTSRHWREQLARVRPERLRGTTTPRPRRLSEHELAAQLGGTLEAEGLIRVDLAVDLGDPRGAGPREPLREPGGLPCEPSRANAQWLYLDTETTGLSGGSGTVSFLIGIATLAGAQLRLTQWLITRFGAERQQLERFTAAITADSHLVSYNGKSFDLPLLATRLRLQGLTGPLPALPHLDLLHPVRRLFGSRWPDCRLGSVEERLLGLRREHDLPGSEAPQAWFDWLQRGDAERLLGIVAHNRQDLVSLAVAHAVIGDLDRLEQRDDIDLHGLAKWWLDDGDEARAQTLLERHFDRLEPRGLRLHARLQQRRGNWSAAVAVWEALAARGCEDSIECLAKYHEHRRRDYATAYALSRRLGANPDSQRRVERLRRKLECA
ncbi:MAG: ribonuclease H-like domain-containing protein [Thiotrichales bacterium]